MKKVAMIIILISFILLNYVYSTSAKTIIDSDTIANISEIVSKSVVNIDTSIDNSKKPQEKKTFNFGGVELNIPNIIPEQKTGTGSGIVIKSDGYILTNHHVVKNADRITVTLKDDETKYEGKLIAYDHYSDLAIIKIETKNLPVAKFGVSKTLRPGDWVIAIGSPLGLGHTVTLGIISALSRHVGVSFGAAQGAFKYIQTDAAINPGNSGGPLVNLNGEVIGINTFIIGQNAQNLNFAIPSDYVSSIADKLLTEGTIKHPFLGVKMVNIDHGVIQSEGLAPNIKGIYVVSVMPESPAEKAGLQGGDIIQQADGKDIFESREIADLVRLKKVGDSLNFKVLRKNELKIISVILGNLPEQEEF